MSSLINGSGDADTRRFLETLKKALNEKQYEAVTGDEGPLLVLAGAGSGKTRVLTYRIAYLVAMRGVPIHRILAVTFTNKAAGEMKERLIELLGDDVRDMWVGTFHSIYARILRRHLDVLGMRNDFVIYDSDDSLRLVKRIQKELEISTTEHTPQQIRGSISRAKNDLLDPERFSQNARGPYQYAVADVYHRYEKQLRENNALDFDDLLVLPIRLFREHSDVLDIYRSRFLHILVDEYQDTNRAQYESLTLLASLHRNLCVVGDDDQSIYRWRGARLRNILDFESEYRDAAVVRLERNYRSTSNILKAASSVVANNVGRKEKTLWTEKETGSPVKTMVAYDETDEASQIAYKVQELCAAGFSLGDQVVLYRINAQSRTLEDTLTHQGIPYRIVGGLRFYERKEIKDILAYLKVALNPRDDISLIRILNVPPRGIGDTSRQRLFEYASRNKLSLFNAVVGYDPEHPPEDLAIRGKAARGLASLGELLSWLHDRITEVHVGELTKGLVEELHIISILEEERSIEAEGRIENIRELLTATNAYQGSDGSGSIQEFLEEVSLITQVDETEFGGDFLTLMTLHCAKGLEFPVVYIVGVEEGLLPWHRALNDMEELEEERRLFYVGMTRARERLILSYVTNRYQGGFGMMSRGASRFLKEIPQECLETSGSPVGSYFPKRRPYAPGARRRSTQKSSRSKTHSSSTTSSDSSVTLDYSSSQVPPTMILAMGKRVEHPIHGQGLVVARHGFGESLEVDVRFADGSILRFPANSGELRPISIEY